MGVVHKLKPEVLTFILENKQNNPALSCRNLTQLILDRFQITVSKSSINSIFKEHNLSMPIGRRQKPKRKKFNMPALPVIKKGDGSTFPALDSRKIEPSPFLPPSPEEKRIKEAEEWAMKLQEEERIRVEEKLKLEKQNQVEGDIKKKAEETEVRALLEEAARVKAKEEEKAAEEAGLKAEREKWARLAEEEHKARQQKAEEVVLPKEEPAAVSSPSGGGNCSGAVLLKALDYLIGASKEINEAVCRQMGVLPESTLPLTEAVIFRSLSGKDNISALWQIACQEYSREKLDNHYAQIQQLKNIKSDIVRIFSGIFTEARGVKLHFIDGSVINLDGQMHSTWSTQNIPYDFSASVYELKNNLNRSFFQSRPLILFSAPGYDVMPRDFFSLLLNLGSTDKYPDTLTIFGNKSEDLEKIPLDNKNNYSLLFGLWPWQFTSSRKVKKIGDFNLSHIEGIGQDFYLADIEIDLLQASTNQSISLKGCAIKTNPAEKIRLVVLNSSKEPMGLDELAGIYLNRWPNLDEAFHDFSRKIELFAYVSNAQKFFSKDSCGKEIDIGAPNLELAVIFEGYIKILDAYLRWHFLPSGYIENDFSFTSKHFYKMPVRFIAGPAISKVQMQVEQGYQFLKDLEYLIRRLNERQINLPTGARLYFENAFK